MREATIGSETKPNLAFDDDPVRIALTLDGDPATVTAAGTKFGLFVDAVEQHPDLGLIAVGDSTLGGAQRGMAAAAAFRPNVKRWKEHYRKNPLTFQLRSRQTRRWVKALPQRPDLVFQIAAMSRPLTPDDIPYVLYLDFTFALTRREWPERAPMASFELPLWRRLETETYHGAAAIFCRSQHVANSLRDDYAVSMDKVHVVGAGVNLALPESTAFLQRDQQRVLFIGSDFRRKGGDVVLDAWREVQRRVPGASLMMIGPVDVAMPPGVESNGGRWSPGTVVEELQRAAVFVMPSRCETWGDVFLEAMAYGVPCIGTSNDAMPEIIRDGETGYIVPPDDPTILADRICDLLLNPERATVFGHAGRQRVIDHYLWPDVVEQMVPILRNVRDVARQSHPQ